MIRLVLIVVVILLAIVGGVAVALHHFYGWKGLIAFPFVLIALVWLAKIVIGKLARKFFRGLIGGKSGVLRGAAMTVHSVRAVPKPTEPPEDEAEQDGEAEAEDESGDETEPEEQEEVRHYFAVDMTITPQPGSGDRVWEPGELLLAKGKLSSLEDLEDESNEVGTTETCLIWKGAQFAPDEECKYPGQQRLLTTFSVKPGTSQAWLHYYSEPLGALELPPWNPTN